MGTLCFKSLRFDYRVVEYDKRCRRTADFMLHEDDSDIASIDAKRLSCM